MRKQFVNSRSTCARHPGLGKRAFQACSLLAILVLGGPVRAQAAAVVYVAPVEGIIDLGLAPFIKRALDEAQQARAAAVILPINTFGGRVDAAVLIRDALLTATVPTVAFIDKRAISAGALIALAAGKIAIAQGGTIGAATPVRETERGVEFIGICSSREVSDDRVAKMVFQSEDAESGEMQELDKKYLAELKERASIVKR